LLPPDKTGPVNCQLPKQFVILLLRIPHSARVRRGTRLRLAAKRGKRAAIFYLLSSILYFFILFNLVPRDQHGADHGGQEQ